MLILIGFLLPALLGTITKHISDKDARFWASASIAGLFGSIVNFVEHNGSAGYMGMTMLEVANTLAESVMAMIGMVKISYEAVWNNEAISKLLPNLKGESPLKSLDLKPE